MISNVFWGKLPKTTLKLSQKLNKKRKFPFYFLEFCNFFRIMRFLMDYAKSCDLRSIMRNRNIADYQKPCLDKPVWINTCKDLAEHFTTYIFNKYSDMQQIRLIFDRYDVLSSLKSATWSKRQGTQDPIHYHITDSTPISNIPLTKLISSLSEYFDAYCFEYTARLQNELLGSCPWKRKL